MEGGNPMAIDEGQHRNWPATSPEIVEIGEVSESKGIVATRDCGAASDVYVAVGKNDLHVLKWAIDRVISPGNRVILVHVFPPITYIPTPVGRLSRSQLSKDQLQVCIREENNKRKHLLDKYIQLCNDSKIEVDTMLVESNASAKAILELIAVANITHLVMGTKQSPFSRLSRKGQGKGDYVKKYAPEYCEVTVVYDDGKKMKDQQPQNREDSRSKTAANQRPRAAKNSERHFFECVCFSGRIFEAKEQYKEAIVAFAVSFSIVPDFVPSIVSTAGILMKMSNRSLHIAKSFFMRRLEPTSHEAWLSLRPVYKIEMQQAVDAFQAAHELKLSDPVRSFV